MGGLQFSLKKPLSCGQREEACPIPGEASHLLFLQIVHHDIADEQLSIGVGGGNAVPLAGGGGPQPLSLLLHILAFCFLSEPN